MSIATISLLTLICFVLTIVISVVIKSNTGIIGLGFAILLAIITQTPWKTVVSGFPTSVFVTIIGVTTFFGYFLENGTIAWTSKKILHTFRKTRRALPFALFFIALVLGATGGPSSAGFIAALVFPVAYGAGLNPIHAAVITLTGANCGANAPFGQFGAVASGIISTVNDGMYADHLLKIGWSSFFLQLLSYIIVHVILYFVFRCHKITSDIAFEEPEPLTPVQRKSLIMVAVVLCLVIFPPVLAKIFPGTIIAAIADYCDITLICFLGCIANVFLNLGNESNVIKRVPWGSGIMIAGMGMLISVATTLGVVDYLAHLVSNVPDALVAPVLMVLAGIMSTFASSMSVVFPPCCPSQGRWPWSPARTR